MKVIYPQAPANLPADFARPGKDFKSGVIRVVASLVFFITVYLVLLVAAGILAFCFALAGWYLVAAKVHFMTVLIALGLVATGLMIFYFLVKFVFENKKADREGLLEITADEHPDLFEFVKQVSEEVGTDFPGHIYLTKEVNAFVFYDSNILSLFFPVKKNLAIGLGMVNMLNLSEFKAVLAHEFGHFSQKSMRAGNYVYQANRIIYNMLYDNKSYGSILDDIARIHGVLALFVRLTISFVQGMQWIQQQAYKIVNIQYNFLSRQMEFHADAIAAGVAGGNNLNHALQLLDVGSTVYHATLHQYNQWLREGIMAVNLYNDQQTAARYFAIANRLPYKGNLPVMKNAGNYFVSFRKVNVDNPWASHPTNEQREEALLALNAIAEEVDTSAWALFQQPEKLQEKFTKDLYKDVKWDKPATVAKPGAIEEAFKEEQKKFDLPEFYEGYYDSRVIAVFGTDHVIGTAKKIDDIKAFFHENAHVGKQRNDMQEDVALLQQIVQQPTAVRKFNFDGAMHPAKWAETVKLTVEADIKRTDEEIAEKDKRVYAYFYAAARLRGEQEQIEQCYNQYFSLQNYLAECQPKFVKLLNELYPLYSDDKFTDIYKHSPQDLSEAIQTLKILYREAKNLFNTINANYNCPLPEKVVQFMEQKLATIKNDACTSQNVNEVYETTYDLFMWLQDSAPIIKKQLLDVQLKYV